MDKFFNLFKNKKEEKEISNKDKEKNKENSIAINNNSTPKKEQIITTQNLENFANIINHHNIEEENIQNEKSINFSNEDINKIEDLIDKKEKISVEKIINPTKIIGDVVTVNSYEEFKKNTKGFYTNKYKEQLQKLKAVKY